MEARSPGSAARAGHRGPGVVIIGAGLFGCGLALDLARRGLRSTLIDRDRLPLLRAARRNEGKIHLGFVYGAEQDARTAALMLQGALAFRPIVSDWIGAGAWRALTISAPYHYLVHRDSLLSPSRLRGHYAAVQRLYEEACNAPDTDASDYLGERPVAVWRPLAPHESHAYRHAPVLEGFATAERAIDPEGLCDALSRRVLADPLITWRPDTVVEAVARVEGGFEIRGRRRGEAWTGHAAVVVNGAWDSRLAIDRTLGLGAPEGHLLRLKYRVIVDLPQRLQGAASQTLVLGRFGDIVILPGGRACLSWYPECLRGWSQAAEPPESWHGPCLGQPEGEEAGRIAEATLRGLDPFLPGLEEARVRQVDAGVIVARGRSDVDDPASGLHSRDAIGLLHHSSEGYFSVDQGKWTTAPLHARRVATILAGKLAGATG